MADVIPTPQVIINAGVDSKTIEDAVNGAPDTQVTSRLGRKFWTLATINSRLELVVLQADEAIRRMNEQVDTVSDAATDAQDNIEAIKQDVSANAVAAIDVIDVAKQSVNDKASAAKSDIEAIKNSTQAALDSAVQDFEQQGEVVLDDFRAAITTIVQDDGIPVQAVVVGDKTLDVVLNGKADKATVTGMIDDIYQSLDDNLIKNGAALPYDPQIAYNDNAIINDNGTLKIVEGGNLELAVKADGVQVGDTTLNVFAEKVKANRSVKFLRASEVGLKKWIEFKKPPYSATEYEEAHNNGLNLTAAIKQAYDEGYTNVVVEKGSYPFCYQNPTGGTFSANRQGEIKLRDIEGIDLDFNFSTLFVIFDSNNRSPYDNSTAAPYMLFGAVFDVMNSRDVTVRKCLVRGDQFNRSWVEGEEMTEQTYGVLNFKNAVNVNFEQCTFYGFRGDGIGGAGRGDTIANLNTWIKGGLDVTTGTAIEQVGAYNSGMITLDRSKIIDDSVQVAGTGNILAAYFRDMYLRAFFYKADGSYIGSEIFKQTDFLKLPIDCEKLTIVAYGDERIDATVSYGLYVILVTGSADGLTVNNCLFTQNHRGGISNNAGRSLVTRSLFIDIGYQKYNFPDYGDPTRFGVDYENVYMGSLTVRDCYFNNIAQGVLGGVQDLIVEDCTFENIEFGGSFAYGAATALFKNNKYRNVLRAFGYQHSGEYLRKTLIAHDNILENCGVLIDISNRELVNFEIRDNTFIKCNLVAKGNGKNLIVKDNNFRDSIEPSNYTAAIDIQGAYLSSGNTIQTKSDNVNYNYFAFYSTIGRDNVFLIDRNNITRFREPLENKTVDIVGLNIDSVISGKKFQHRLTNKSKGWATHTDSLNHKNCEFKNLQLEFYGLDGQNFYNTIAKFDDCKIASNTQIIITKREIVDYDVSDTTLIFKNCEFDLTSATRLIYNTYAILGNLNIVFLNCVFVADTPTTISIVQGVLTNITSQAIGCRFINVTNSDGITVDENGNIITP